MRFEKVKRFADSDINLPYRATKYSAGYDFEVAEDIVIPSAFKELKKIATEPHSKIDLSDMEQLTKSLGIRPTLVPTGIKCKLEDNKYLKLAVRSSLPLKSWLILANGEGLIDADYFGNADNDGEIFFQLINLGPIDIQLHRGDRIGQGVILEYFITEDDHPGGIRTGGLGSTK